MDKSTELKGIRAIYIDDEISGQAQLLDNCLSTLFGQENYQSFESGTDALSYIKRDPASVDIAIIDYILSGPNGLGTSVGKQITELSSLSSCIAVVILSGKEGFDDCREAMRSGFDDYLLKSDFMGTRRDVINEQVSTQLLHVLNLPNVKAKFSLKKELIDKNLRLRNLTAQINKVELDDNNYNPNFLENGPCKKIIKILDAQEEVLVLFDQHKQKKSRLDGDALGLAIRLNLIGVDLCKSTESSQDYRNGVWYDTPKKLINDIENKSQLLGIAKKNGILAKKSKDFRSSIQSNITPYSDYGRITTAGLNLYRILKIYPNKWTFTRLMAKSSSDGTTSTFIDKIYRDYF